MVDDVHLYHEFVCSNPIFGRLTGSTTFTVDRVAFVL
jgi:hypothetical protein